VTLPTCFIISAREAETTSVHHHQDLHPEIQMSANASV
jgi:hypothetical protein